MRHISVIHAIFWVTMFRLLFSGSPATAQPAMGLSFNQDFIEGLNTPFPLDSGKAMFDWVYQGLPDSVFVYPTENYYYFRAYVAGRWIWGNMRLGILDRDKGKLHFAYYYYVDNPTDPGEGDLQVVNLDASNGLLLEKVRPLCYRTTWQGKKVIFQLNDLAQKPPARFDLPADEVFINRTCDESGFPFFLIYKGDQNHFMFVLNEEKAIPGKLVPLADGLVWDQLSGFVFYVDSLRQQRKILVGVWAQNIRRNNYWDGPFDQLADNEPHPQFKNYLEQAYPYAKGGLDGYGFFRTIQGARIAITPYFEYESLDQFLENFKTCRTAVEPKEFFACLCYDEKTSYSGNER
ncbi:MAG: hypothetical protein ABMA02_07185 [Saprospiraceae bacterium]